MEQTLPYYLAIFYWETTKTRGTQTVKYRGVPRSSDTKEERNVTNLPSPASRLYRAQEIDRGWVSARSCIPRWCTVDSRGSSIYRRSGCAWPCSSNGSDSCLLTRVDARFRGFLGPWLPVRWSFPRLYDGKNWARCDRPSGSPVNTYRRPWAALVGCLRKPTRWNPPGTGRCTVARLPSNVKQKTRPRSSRGVFRRERIALKLVSSNAAVTRPRNFPPC